MSDWVCWAGPPSMIRMASVKDCEVRAGNMMSLRPCAKSCSPAPISGGMVPNLAPRGRRGVWGEEGSWPARTDVVALPEG